MKISDLKVNDKTKITLVVLSAVARETRAKKPYLMLEFFDGVEKISGNFWDWSGEKIPEVNSILDVICTVTEWQGVKQLNIAGLKINTERHLNEFMPSSTHDISTAYKELYSYMSDVKNDTLRNIALTILEELSNLWLTIPGARSVHHAYVGGTLIHSLSVCKIAKAIAETMPNANVDLTVVGAALHDIGKLFTYEINGIAIDTTDEGKLFDHTFIGANHIRSTAHLLGSIIDESVLGLLTHIVLSHHGKQEYGAVVTPQCIEAYIVHMADNLDATCEQIAEASLKAGYNQWTDKIWALENRPHLSVQYVDSVLGGK